MNKINLIGRMARDPELKQTQTGKSVCRFAIAVNRRTKNDQGNYDADFFNCIAWTSTAENICKYFQKGSRIGLSGALQNNTWTDKNGTKRVDAEIWVDDFDFIDSKASQPATNSTPTSSASDPFDGFIVDADADSLPWD